MVRFWVLVLAALTMWAGVAQAQSAPPPLMAGLPDMPPLAFTSRQGALDGSLGRVVTRLFEDIGLLAWSGGAYPAPRLVKGLQDGSFHFAILVRVPALSECCLFSARPVFTMEPAVFYLTGTRPVRSKEELSGRSLIVENGFSYAGMIGWLRDPAHAIRLEEAESLGSAFRMLRAGRAEYLLSYQANARDYLADHPLEGVRSQVIGSLPAYLVLSRTYPDAEGLMKRLEAAAARLDIPGMVAAYGRGQR